MDVVSFICNLMCNNYTVAVLSVCIVLKVWLKCTTGVYRSDRRMDGKTVIVTGANTGIGKETAADLAGRGARVILACRDLVRGTAARDEIVERTGNQAVLVHRLDLGSISSVRDFAKTIIKTERRLDVLINNAGASGLGMKMSKDELHLGMQINHFGPFLLTNLLLGLMKASTPSRIVFVSSVVHKYANLEVDNLNCYKPINDFMIYNNSKLANILVANELARKLEGTDVTVNSVHPGAVKSEFMRKLPKPILHIVNLISSIFFKSPAEGAQTSIYLAVSSQVEGITGKYFKDCKEVTPSASARNQDLARKVWNMSMEYVKLKSSEVFY